MTHLQKAPRKPLFLNEKQGKCFIALFNNEIEKRIAKCIFIDGLTNEETALEIGYCTRQIERIRKNMLEVALKMLVEMRTPKKPIGIYDENIYHIDDDDYIYEPARFGGCPACNQEVQDGMLFCSFCGQALDWSDTE